MTIKLWPDREIRVEKKRVGQVPMLILRPKDAAAGMPGMLWIHGGGYITGMKEMVYMSRAVDLVKKYGVTVVSPGYRLAWLHPWPAAAEVDVYPTDMHAFDMLRPQDAVSQEAIRNFEQHFEQALRMKTLSEIGEKQE